MPRTRSTISLLLLILTTSDLGCGTVRDQTIPIDPGLTYQYWSQIGALQKSAILEFQKDPAPEVATLVECLSAMAQSIEALSTNKVDPDAVEAAHALGDAMRKLARFAQQKLDTTTWRDALVGLQSEDSFPRDKDSEEALALRAVWQSTARRVRKIQATLTRRYVREFASLDVSAPDQLWFLSEITKISPTRELSEIRQKLSTLDRSLTALSLQLGQVMVDAQMQVASIANLVQQTEIANDLIAKNALLAEVEVKRTLLLVQQNEVETLKQQRDQLVVVRADVADRLGRWEATHANPGESAHQHADQKAPTFENEVRKAEQGSPR